MLDVLQKKLWMFKGDLVIIYTFMVFGHLYIFYLKGINVMNFPKILEMWINVLCLKIILLSFQGKY